MLSLGRPTAAEKDGRPMREEGLNILLSYLSIN
jgi:hypothetical protein